MKSLPLILSPEEACRIAMLIGIRVKVVTLPRRRAACVTRTRRLPRAAQTHDVPIATVYAAAQQAALREEG